MYLPYHISLGRYVFTKPNDVPGIIHQRHPKQEIALPDGETKKKKREKLLKWSVIMGATCRYSYVAVQTAQCDIYMCLYN